MDAAQRLAVSLAGQPVTGSKPEPGKKLAVGREDLSVLIQNHQEAAHRLEHGLDHWIGQGLRGQTSEGFAISALRWGEVRLQATRSELHPILPSHSRPTLLCRRQPSTGLVYTPGGAWCEN